jgi:hypothetical protein
MIDRFRGWLRTHPYAKWVYPVCLGLTVILFFAAFITGNGFIWLYLSLGLWLCIWSDPVLCCTS